MADEIKELKRKHQQEIAKCEAKLELAKLKADHGGEMVGKYWDMPFDELCKERDGLKEVIDMMDDIYYKRKLMRNIESGSECRCTRHVMCTYCSQQWD